jgi:hypothetical protein
MVQGHISLSLLIFIYSNYIGEVLLSGGAACHWYFNPSIEEVEAFYSRYNNYTLPPFLKKKMNNED